MSFTEVDPILYHIDMKVVLPIRLFVRKDLLLAITSFTSIVCQTNDCLEKSFYDEVSDGPGLDIKDCHIKKSPMPLVSTGSEEVTI